MGPIAVVESRWWTDGNHTVRHLFEAVAAIHYDNPSAFFYDMFADKSSLRTVLKQRAKDNSTEVIYVASHGDENHIGPVSRAEFRNVLKESNRNAQLKGLFLGTCLTGNAWTVDFLMRDGQSHLDWIAGYRESVDWIDGSAIDMVFMSTLAHLYVLNRRKRRGKLSAVEMAHKAATRLLRLIPGAHTEYGFNFYSRDRDEVRQMFT